MRTILICKQFSFAIDPCHGNGKFSGQDSPDLTWVKPGNGALETGRAAAEDLHRHFKFSRMPHRPNGKSAPRCSKKMRTQP
jgi:hypothetical protein